MKNLLVFLTDVWSGRVWDTFELIFNELRTLQGRVKEIKTMTENEQKLINAAQQFAGLFATLAGVIEDQKSKILLLQDQAASEAAHVPEDLSDEFQTLNGVLEKGQALVDGLAPSAPAAPVDVADQGVPQDLPPATPVMPGDPSDPGPGMDPASPAPTTPTEETMVPVADPITEPPVEPIEDSAPVTDTSDLPANPDTEETLPAIDTTVPATEDIVDEDTDDDEGWGEDDPDEDDSDDEEGTEDPAPPVPPTDG